MKPADPGFFESEEWKAWRAPGFHRRGKTPNDLAKNLDSDDISALIARLSAGSAEEQSFVLGLLYVALVKLNLSLAKDQAPHLIERLTALMAAYPNMPGLDAFNLLHQLEPDIAEQLLLEKGDDPDVFAILPSAPTQFPYAYDLMSVGSIRAMDRVVQYSRLEREKGGGAARLLKRLGLIEPREIAELAARWRQSKSLQYLNDLCSFHIEHQAGRPIAPLLTLLGPWTKRDSNTYWFQSAEGPSLFLKQDEQGNLISYQVK